MDTGSAYNDFIIPYIEPSVVPRQPLGADGKAARAVELYSGGPRRDRNVAVRFCRTPTQFLQVLESTQCDGVPVRVAGGAQEERNLAAEQAERLGPRGDAVPELREPTVQSALVCGSNMGGCM